MSRSSRSARSWAARRSELVPTSAPSARSFSDNAPHSASYGSARGGTAAIARPSASRAGTSLAECTARSTSPRRSAASISRTQRSLSPRARSRSPDVVIVTTSTSPPSAAATSRACARARALPRGPARGGGRCRGCRASRPALQRVHVGRLAVRLFRLGGASGVVDPEQLAQELLAGVAGGVVVGVLELQRRLVQQPLHHRARDGLDPREVARRSALPPTG